MGDVWFAIGLTEDDLDLCREALAMPPGHDAPLLAAARRDDEAPRLVLASRDLFQLFRVDDGAALSERLLKGNEPGARRLALLQDTLPLEGAPRLERLRFSIGPVSEMITVLCRRIRARNGDVLFVAAALGLRSGLVPPPAVTSVMDRPAAGAAMSDRGGSANAEDGGLLDRAVVSRPANPNAALSVGDTPIEGRADSEPAAPHEPSPDRPAVTPLADGALDLPSIHAALRRRWPGRRTVRFLWQSDGDCLCTQISPPLAEIVGTDNAELVGKSLLALAPRLDPSGRFERALRSRETWSGIDVSWPIDGASAGVGVGLGASPILDADRAFAGYRGYGIARLDELLAREPTRLRAEDAGGTGKVIAFPSKGLSAEDQKAFVALGAQLRDDAGFGADERVVPAPAPEAPPASAIAAEVPEPAAAIPEPATAEGRGADNGLALLDKLSTGVLVSRDNVPIFANRHFLGLTGFANVDALHEAGGMAHLFGGMPGNASGAESIDVRTRDGATVPATARVQRVEWDGLPASLLTLQSEVRPTPEPKPAAAEPKPTRDDDERHELRAILETATDGVVVMDADCLVLSLNRAGEALFGRDRGDVIGKPFVELFATHDRDLARDYLEGVKSDPTRSLLNDGREFLVMAAQGGSIPVFMTLGRLSSARDAASPGKPMRYCALFRDLTHWKKVEGELEEARRAAEQASTLKSDFLAKVSHEIRTPLNAIIGFAEVILEERFGPLGSQRYKDYLRDIRGSGAHVLSLVNDLLDLSKIQAGKMELSPQPVDINQIVSECVALMQPQASRERVIMRLALAQALPRITADERSLRQITLNILSNAVKFNEPGGQVIVATHKTESGHVVMRIRDTGPGMSEADIATALEPFRQLSPSRSDPSGVGGTGLGLPLTKALAEANDAVLAIRSKRDQGTLVEVAFPPARVLAAG